MSIILKILQKSDPSYHNYQPLIEHALPVLFTVDKNTDTFIGFVNVYQPARGHIAFTLTKTNPEAVQQLIQTNSKLNSLFPNGIHYDYNNGTLTKTRLNQSTLNNYTPHKDVRFIDFPNKINLERKNHATSTRRHQTHHQRSHS